MTKLITEKGNVRCFHRKTKRGQIIKIVREHYLRTDITCGINNCKICQGDEITIVDDDAKEAIYLSSRPRSGINKLCSSAHLIIPDVNVFLTQMDVLEDESFGNDVIVLQTVRNEVRYKNLSLYSRIKDIPKKRNFYVFVNEYSQNTYLERLPKESSEQYVFRLTINAAKWYQSHIGKGVKIILLVNDTSSKVQAIEAGVTCYTLSEYVQNLNNNINLMDKIVTIDEEQMEVDPQSSTSLVAKKFLYPEHLPLSMIQKGVKEGKYYQAKFSTNRENYLEGSVTISLDEEPTRVLISGRESINRAIHDDIVAVELLPKEQWKTRSGVVLTADLETQEKDEEELEDSEAVTKMNIEDPGEKKPTGKVVGIIKRNWRQYCGILRERSSSLIKSMVVTGHFFVPIERRIPLVRIETRQYEILKNQRIVVAIDSWPRDSKFPRGHYVRALGPIGEKETENELLLLEHDVPHLQFSKAVMKCLPDPEKWTIPPEELARRLDLRNKPICSVDPPGCTDIDDALHCIDLGNNVYEVGVHIADVSYFVKPNTAIDLEAANRGTTVYLVDNRIDMIPTVLSSNLCSLLEKQDRLTFSVIWKINATTAQVIDTQFTKSIIKSKGALTYAEAQLRIDSKNLNDDVTQGLRRLNKLAKILKKQRLEKGALVLANLGEIKFIEVDSETHDNVTKIESKQLQETNSMVEEFMLLANISVAEKLYQEVPQLALLRHHSKPSPADFDELIQAGKACGFEIDVKDGKSLSRSLNRAVDPKNSYLNLMVRMITTRCMTQAKYFCSGKMANPENNYTHFGLASPIYTHFTSPIRRYADLIVHRELSHVIGDSNLDPKLTSSDKIQALCENINYRHQQAQYASRSSIKLHTLIHIRSAKKPLEEDGYILYVRKNAIQILIPRLAFEATYFFEVSSDWEFDGLFGVVKHLKSDKVLKQFDPVKVKLTLVDRSTEFRKGAEIIDVQLLEPFIPVSDHSLSKPK